MDTRHVCVSRLFALRREVCSSCVEIISLVLTCTPVLPFMNERQPVCLKTTVLLLVIRTHVVKLDSYKL